VASFDSGVMLYLRLRGRVTGPFTHAQLVRMREQGGLSRFHEVSADGITWQLASDAGLLPSPSASRSDLQLTVDAVRPAQPTVAEAPKRWFYLDTTGGQQGPLSRDEVADLVRQNIVRGQTLVWCEGQAGWLSAAQTELAALLPAAALEPADQGGGIAVNPAALIAGLLLVVLGMGCFVLAWVEEMRLAEIDRQSEQRPAPRPGSPPEPPVEPVRPATKESRTVVYLLIGAGVFLGGTGIGVLVLGAFRRRLE
jgi:hypothetical protein